MIKNYDFCAAFMYCAAGIPAWCTNNCFYYTHTCPSASEANGFHFYRKKGKSGFKTFVIIGDVHASQFIRVFFDSLFQN